MTTFVNYWLWPSSSFLINCSLRELILSSAEFRKRTGWLVIIGSGRPKVSSRSYGFDSKRESWAALGCKLGFGEAGGLLTKDSGPFVKTKTGRGRSDELRVLTSSGGGGVVVEVSLVVLFSLVRTGSAVQTRESTVETIRVIFQKNLSVNVSAIFKNKSEFTYLLSLQKECIIPYQIYTLMDN